MPYDIELMSIGRDVYPLLKRAADQLNGIQREFRFDLTAESQRADGVLFQRQEYRTPDIWAFLKDHKEKFGGRRKFIIAFVSAPLSSPRLRNIFGSHQAADGLAVVTTFGTAQYVREEIRYFCYYMVRYSLSFVNPLIRAHNVQGRESCYFHMKMYKPDILASMNSAVLCDVCSNELDNPPPNSSANRLSAEEKTALRKMREHVSGDLPKALVMKGGGVKGLAFTGALLELEQHMFFDRHVGTSAGSIAAVLLAASYTPAELKDILLEKSFSDFLDAPLWRLPINLLFKQGLYPGQSFLNWIGILLESKLTKHTDILMSDLKSALIYACRGGDGTIEFDSIGQRNDAVAAFATRCSMSIPFLFQPMYLDDRPVFDGGLRSNFPLERFLKNNHGRDFVALYLARSDENPNRRVTTEMLDILIDGEERKTVQDHIDNVVSIDTSPIGTIDFGLSPLEKEFLFCVGKAAALEFISRRKLDNGPPMEDVQSSKRMAEDLRTRVRAVRKRRATIRLAIVLGALVLLQVLHVLGVF